MSTNNPRLRFTSIKNELLISALSKLTWSKSENEKSEFTTSLFLKLDDLKFEFFKSTLSNLTPMNVLILKSALEKFELLIYAPLKSEPVLTTPSKLLSLKFTFWKFTNDKSLYDKSTPWKFMPEKSHLAKLLPFLNSWSQWFVLLIFKTFDGFIW